MQQLVTDVLDLARMERGLFVLHPRPVALQSCLEQCFLAFAVPGHARGLQMHLQLAPDLPQAVRMDAVRVRQVLNNLLGNALKFTDAGSITLRAQWQPRAASARAGPAAGILQLSVHDTGRGIAPDVMQRLFVEFEQGDDAIAPLYGGYGLGLALCRQLLQLMGGQITAHSQPGQGSSFHVQLPLDLAELDTEAAAPGDGAAAPAVQAPAPGPGVGA
jgi:signal transduction histidine kinase